MRSMRSLCLQRITVIFLIPSKMIFQWHDFQLYDPVVISTDHSQGIVCKLQLDYVVAKNSTMYCNTIHFFVKRFSKYLVQTWIQSCAPGKSQSLRINS